MRHCTGQPHIDWTTATHHTLWYLSVQRRYCTSLSATVNRGIVSRYDICWITPFLWAQCLWSLDAIGMQPQMRFFPLLQDGMILQNICLSTMQS